MRRIANKRLATGCSDALQRNEAQRFHHNHAVDRLKKAWAFDLGKVAHAAIPDRAMNSDCQAGKGTAPSVAASIRRAVSASGNRIALAYRLTATWVLPIASANVAWLLSGCFSHSRSVEE
jgi:hypothetical protein